MSDNASPVVAHPALSLKSRYEEGISHIRSVVIPKRETVRQMSVPLANVDKWADGITRELGDVR